MDHYPIQHLLRPFFVLGMMVWFVAVYAVALLF